MTEFEDIQRLIRLKRHELPPVGFVDDFMATLKERQRGELLQGSARGLLWERVTTYFADLFIPKWAMAGATAVAVSMGIFMLKPASQATSQVAHNATPATTTVESVSTPIKDGMSGMQNHLISHHYGGGFADEQNVQPVSLTGLFQGGVQTAGFKGDLETSLEQQR